MGAYLSGGSRLPMDWSLNMTGFLTYWHTGTQPHPFVQPKLSKTRPKCNISSIDPVQQDSNISDEEMVWCKSCYMTKLQFQPAIPISIYSSGLDYHPQYTGYRPGTGIKQERNSFWWPLATDCSQADAVLLAFPLQFPMADSTLRQDLTIYGLMVRDSGPAMTWSIHTILWLQLGEEDIAEHFFNRSYQPHVAKPFGIWTENRWVRGSAGDARTYIKVHWMVHVVSNLDKYFHDVTLYLIWDLYQPPTCPTCRPGWFPKR